MQSHSLQQSCTPLTLNLAPSILAHHSVKCYLEYKRHCYQFFKKSVLHAADTPVIRTCLQIVSCTVKCTKNNLLENPSVPSVFLGNYSTWLQTNPSLRKNNTYMCLPTKWNPFTLIFITTLVSPHSVSYLISPLPWRAP